MRIGRSAAYWAFSIDVDLVYFELSVVVAGVLSCLLFGRRVVLLLRLLRQLPLLPDRGVDYNAFSCVQGALLVIRLRVVVLGRPLCIISILIHLD